MPTIEEIIDAEIQQLSELKRMAQNPRMLEIMRQIVGNGNQPKIGPVRKFDISEMRSAPPLTGAEIIAERKSAPNGLSTAVGEAVKEMNGTFTLSDIVTKLLRNEFSFVSSSPRVAVGAPVDRLIEKGLVELVERGSGSEPNKYQYVGEK